jgi:hypothetical protein
MTVGAGRQRPSPSQACAAVTAPLSQCPFAHSVPTGWRRQAPAPSQVPSRPHVLDAVAAQVAGSRGLLPADTNVHVPRAVGDAHVLQVSSQGLPQQTLSTQKLLAQSPEQLHGWPSSLRPPSAPVHTTPPSWLPGGVPPSPASGDVWALFLPHPPATSAATATPQTHGALQRLGVMATCALASRRDGFADELWPRRAWADKHCWA